MANKKNEICFLCGKTKNQTDRLIKGKYGYICGDCISAASDLISEEEQQSISNDVQLATPSQIKAYLDKYVIGQEEAKRTLSVAVYNHYKRLNQNRKSDVEIQKSNILMIGSTGSGKTYLAQSLAEFLNVPFAIADATTLTQAGYVGDDAETMLRTLIENADYDIEKAQQGIIYIDEIDKIARKGENTSITRDVSGEGVQQALLKILEGTISEVPVVGGRKHPQAQTTKLDTSNILFICGGAFDGIEKIIGKKEQHNSIGFSADISDKKNDGADLSQVEQHDLVKYGLMPELIGRLPILVTLNPLLEKDLVRILTEPRNALVKQYQTLLSYDGVELEFDQDALEAIASKAIERKTGARGLRSIIEEVMMDVMFEIPSQEDVTKVRITKEAVDGKAAPVLETA